MFSRLNEYRYRFLRWQNEHVPGSVVLVFIAFIIGILTGTAAAVLKRLIKLLNDVVTFGSGEGPLDYRLLIWPLLGIFLTCLYQRYVVRGNLSQGTKIIKEAMAAGKSRMSLLTAFNSVIGCALTMGSGASGGSEGPTALAGASLANNVGQWFRLPPEWKTLLIAIGGGAGIAAIFKSPMGGVFFVLEVLQFQLTSLTVLALAIACMFASASAFVLSDFTFDIQFIGNVDLDPSKLGWIALLGLFCGLYSIYYSYTKNRSQQFFMAIRSPWLGVAATGGLLSICIFLFPSLLGEGFNVMEALVNSKPYSFCDAGVLFEFHNPDLIFIGVSAVLLLKGILVAASYSNGGIAGDFVPTFFAGALAGYLFGIGCNRLFGLDLPVWYFALIGMGCVMAGTIHAPLMSIFILCEATDTYGYIFAYIIAVSVSYATVKIITPKAWYSGTRHDDIMALMSYDKGLSIKSVLPQTPKGKSPDDRSS